MVQLGMSHCHQTQNSFDIYWNVQCVQNTWQDRFECASWGIQYVTIASRHFFKVRALAHYVENHWLLGPQGTFLWKIWQLCASSSASMLTEDVKRKQRDLCSTFICKSVNFGKIKYIWHESLLLNGIIKFNLQNLKILETLNVTFLESKRYAHEIP